MVGLAFVYQKSAAPRRPLHNDRIKIAAPCGCRHVVAKIVGCKQSIETEGTAKTREAIMRTMTVAATMILLLTAYANSQDLNMLRGLDDKRPLSQEEVAKQKAADEAYKAAIGKIPAKKPADPWGQVRDAGPSKK